MQKYEKIFVPVSVEERLPDKNDKYRVNDGKEILVFKDGKWYQYINGNVILNNQLRSSIEIYNWLKEQFNVIVFTPNELKELFYEYQSTIFRSDKIITIEEFLKSKGILAKKVTIDFTIWCFENFRYYNKTNQVFVSSKFDEEGNETYNYTTKEDAYSLYQIAVEKEFYET